MDQFDRLGVLAPAPAPSGEHDTASPEIEKFLPLAKSNGRIELYYFKKK